MTDLARSMFNCTRALSMSGAQKILDALDVEGGPPACSMSMPSMSVMDALNPLYWLKLGGEILKRPDPGALLDGRPMASVLDHMPDPTPGPKTLPSAAVQRLTQSTGWGPMP